MAVGSGGRKQTNLHTSAAHAQHPPRPFVQLTATDASESYLGSKNHHVASSSTRHNQHRWRDAPSPTYTTAPHWQGSNAPARPASPAAGPAHAAHVATSHSVGSNTQPRRGFTTDERDAWKPAPSPRGNPSTVWTASCSSPSYAKEPAARMLPACATPVTPASPHHPTCHASPRSTGPSPMAGVIMSQGPMQLQHVQHAEPESASQRLLSRHALNSDFARKYQITCELGAGGFGFVCGAVRRDDGVEVAVKFIIKSRIPSTSWARDKELGVVPMEVYLIKNIRHPNVIAFEDFYSDDKYFYLVTELHGSQWSGLPTFSEPSSEHHPTPSSTSLHSPAPIKASSIPSFPYGQPPSPPQNP
ncbi:hypothetical protein HK101_002324, partial [Irineochytrium annulatum]